MTEQPVARRQRAGLLLALLLIAAAALGAWLHLRRGPAVELRLRLEPGQSYAFHKHDSTAVEGGEMAGQVQLVAVDYTFRVLGRDAAGIMDVAVTCDGVRVSEREAEPAGESARPARALGEILQRHFAMRLSARGRVLELSPPSDAEPGAGADAWANVVRRILEDSLAVYPAGPVRVGESWAVEGAGPAAAVGGARELRLVGLSEQTAQVELAGEVSAAGAEDLPRVGALAVARSTRGAIELDRRSGLIRSSELTYRLAVRLGAGAESVVRITSATRMRQSP